MFSHSVSITLGAFACTAQHLACACPPLLMSQQVTSMIAALTVVTSTSGRENIPPQMHTHTQRLDHPLSNLPTGSNPKLYNLASSSGHLLCGLPNFDLLCCHTLVAVHQYLCHQYAVEDQTCMRLCVYGGVLGVRGEGKAHNTT